MNAMARLLALTILGCAISGTPLVAATYKWVDEKGAVHYSQTPPANRDYELLRNPPSIKEEPATPAPEAKAPTPAASPPAEDKETREKACQEARTRLEALEKNPGRLVIKQTDGSMHKITEEERLGYIKETTARIDEVCK